MSLQRPCLGPGRGLPCPTDEYVPSGRCSSCRAEVDRARGSTSERGYGAGHQQVRRQLAGTLPAPCGYELEDDCPGGLIQPDVPWVAAHVVDGRPEYGYQVAHPACNERAKRR